MTARAAPSTVADLLWPRSGDGLLRAAVLAVVGSLLLAASSKAQIPFYPVPMTLQPGVVLLIGMTYGPRLGAATVLLFLAEGAAGFPVFAGTPERGIGLAYMAGPTGGYMAGWLLAVLAAGRIAERRPDLPGLALAAVVGTGLIYLPGVLWLAGFVGADRAVSAGLLPFLPGDVLKAALAALLVRAGTRRLPRG